MKYRVIQGKLKKMAIIRSTDRRIVTWDEVIVACKEMSKSIKARSWAPIKTLAPISRGGLVPATIVSYMTDIPIGFTINPANQDLIRSDRNDICVIDDVCDTGETLCRVREKFSHASFHVLFAKPMGLACSRAVWSSEDVAQHVWLQFPWAPNDEVNR